MKVFVIGGTGYIGMSSVEALKARGHSVVALIRTEAQQVPLQKLGVDTLVGDIAQSDSLVPAIQSSNGVVYAAAGQSEAYSKIEQQAIEHILTTLEGSNKPFVKITGSLVFGDTGLDGKTETDDFAAPPPLAGAAELAQMLKIAANKGIRTAQIFASYIYGRGGGDIPQMMLGIAKQRGESVYIADGEAMWSSVHVDDVGQLVALAVEQASAGSVLFPVASVVSLKEIAQAIADATGVDRITSLSMEEAQQVLGFFCVSAHAQPGIQR
ncbi:MAG: hypothetical protein GFH27_549293n327 [Chloroflexi bacterium AL-W]|nr:hypothetical protein [Chloroflexi bacterium AL-N1]NOK67558.1 hypothetical protein [Chloroflexi bacterium AL-N10]NOK75672.1 hypothetical protein [Chloroflexi bacterium AL-N5]NOK82460.1 hypothetical protein [Chloroflexi bacterium AL-W]NOK90305.1 hypothetical protein [Chloroflexi bacterium AL-N15]